MLYLLTLPLLLPLLVKQGWQVRKNMISLPEAAGERVGHSFASHKSPLSLFIIGDSAAVGVGVSTQQDALLGQLTSQLQPQYSLKWQLLAKTGDTIFDLIEAVQKRPKQQWDIIVISIGVNDVVTGTLIYSWRKRIKQLLELLNSRFDPQMIFFTKVPPLHKFPALPQPLAWYLGKRAVHFNKVLKEILGPYPKSHYLDIHFDLTPQNIALDGFHPGAKSYEQWATEVAKRVKDAF